MANPVQHKKQVFPLMGIWALLVIISLTALAVFLRQSAIETDLLQRTRQILSEAGLPADGIYFDGRDSVLTGQVDNDEISFDVAAVVQNVYGVHSVTNQIAVKPGTGNPSDNLSNIKTNPAKGLYVASRQYPIEQVDLSQVKFEYAKAELDSAAMQALEAVAVLLRKNPDQSIEVSAHTDNQGTALGNLAVTNARANVVRDYLLSKGVNATQVVAHGYGSMRPIADNKTEEGRQQNRRIEISVLKEQ